MKTCFQEKDTKHVVTRSHANCVERFIRSVKSVLYKRIMNDEKRKETIQWIDYMNEVSITSNSKLKHDSHGFTTDCARENQNSVDVRLD